MNTSTPRGLLLQPKNKMKSADAITDIEYMGAHHDLHIFRARIEGRVVYAAIYENNPTEAMQVFMQYDENHDRKEYRRLGVPFPDPQPNQAMETAEEFMGRVRDIAPNGRDT